MIAAFQAQVEAFRAKETTINGKPFSARELQYLQSLREKAKEAEEKRKEARNKLEKAETWVKECEGKVVEIEGERKKELAKIMELDLEEERLKRELDFEQGLTL